MTPALDLINAAFELGMAYFIHLSIRQAFKDQRIAGIYWGQTSWATAWGIFNLFFYPAADAPFSFIGGIFVVITNSFYMVTIFWFLWRPGHVITTTQLAAGISDQSSQDDLEGSERHGLRHVQAEVQPHARAAMDRILRRSYLRTEEN